MALAALLMPSAARAQAPWTDPTPTSPPRVADLTRWAPGRAMWWIQSSSESPQRVVIEHRRNAAMTWTRDAPPNLLGSGTCTTPCALYVPTDAYLLLRADGDGMRRTEESVALPAGDLRVTLRAASQAQWNLGVGAVALGATLLAAITGLTLASQFGDGDAPSRTTMLGVGLGAGALLAVGIPLLVVNRTGVSRAVPIAGPREAR